ncbi:MAG: Ni/Fe-hydrogenase, b-type cytochrome subunit [Deltaproteobacteria bacterium]
MEQGLKYEWSWPIRIDHWIRVTAVTVLVFTGFYIHWPFIAGGPDGFLMAWIRFSHFAAAYVLVLGLVIRIYLAFNSAFDRDWKDFGILRNLRDVPDILGYYLFMKGSHKDYRKYNPLQALAYLFIGLVTIFTAITGAALYKGMAFGLINTAESFRWVNAMLGGESYTRIWHYLSMWIFIIFVGIHIYMSILASAVNKDKTFTSIFTGYKLRKKAS